MVTLTETIRHHGGVSGRTLLWTGAVAALAIPLALLTVAIKQDPFPAQDAAVLAWMTRLDQPVLGSLLRGISLITSIWPGLVLGLVGMAFLWIRGLRREALAFGVVGAMVGLVAFVGDYTLGEYVGRTRPEGALSSQVSYPSGHVFGSTVLFGFWIFMAFHYRLRWRLQVPVAAALGLMILAVGPARMYEQAHWPSDVAAGYLFAGIWLLALIPLFLRLRRAGVGAVDAGGEAVVSPATGNVRIVGSIASRVVLDYDRGTATKSYIPPAPVRWLYWLAFQAKFPYEDNAAALETAAHRRKIAGYLTAHRFGKDMVSPVVEIGCEDGKATFVTELVRGEEAEASPAVREVLRQIADTFAEAGLPVWQMNPRNPHAHTNLIRTPEGELKIIDLESAIVTPFPAKGQWRSAIKSGSYPIFDDIDFERLRAFVERNDASLRDSLGEAGMQQFQESIERCELATRAWKDSEPRLPGKALRLAYRLLNWRGAAEKATVWVDRGETVAQSWLENGVARWEAEGRVTPEAAASLRAKLASDAGSNTLRHLGAHLLLTATLRFPFGSIARPAWTLAFWMASYLPRRRSEDPGAEANIRGVHGPVVMALSLVPGLGGFAYLAAKPLRSKLLVRLMLDQSASKLPYGLYSRLGLARLLPPPCHVAGKEYKYRAGDAPWGRPVPSYHPAAALVLRRDTGILHQVDGR